MIKVGSVVQSAYIQNGKKGNLGLVLQLRAPPEGSALAHVFYPKTRTSGWVVIKHMKVVA